MKVGDIIIYIKPDDEGGGPVEAMITDIRQGTACIRYKFGRFTITRYVGLSAVSQPCSHLVNSQPTEPR